MDITTPKGLRELASKASDQMSTKGQDPRITDQYARMANSAASIASHLEKAKRREAEHQALQGLNKSHSAPASASLKPAVKPAEATAPSSAKK